jgi:hypothetical protein
MAISEDTANQPAAVHATGKTATTASFSPQAATLLVMLASVDGNNNAATTVVPSDSLSGVWTLLKRQNFDSGGSLGGSTEVWCQYLLTAPGSMTASAAWSTGTVGGNLVVRSLLGAASAQPGAAGGTGADTIAPTVTLTPTRFGSWVYGACLDWAAAVTFTANAASSVIDQFVDTTNGGTWATFKGAAATTALTSTAYGFTNGNSSYNTAAAEILAATPPQLILGQAVGRASLW